MNIFLQCRCYADNSFLDTSVISLSPHINRKRRPSRRSGRVRSKTYSKDHIFEDEPTELCITDLVDQLSEHIESYVHEEEIAHKYIEENDCGTYMEEQEKLDVEEIVHNCLEELQTCEVQITDNCVEVEKTAIEKK